MSFRLAIEVAVALGSILFAPNSYSQDLLFGLTQFGGANNKGVPYQISVNGTGFISYTDFDGTNGEKPGNGAAFVQSTNEMLYALTELGDQAGNGKRVTVIARQGGLLGQGGFYLHNGSGSKPQGRLLAATNGMFYGVTSADAEYGGGALFYSWPVAINGILGWFPFDGATTGSSPKGGLIEASNRKLYGMTELGGVNNQGVIFFFDYSVPNQAITKILDFNGANNGANPTGNLLEASDGYLYGMTKAGGTNGHGVIFKIAKDGTGFTKLFNFNGAATGRNPLGSLVQYSDGKLYGMTSAGGANGFGTLFSITTGGTFAKILDFNGTNGKTPVGDLLIAPSGNVMYGTTYAGGVNDKGVLFKIENGTQYTKLYDYSAATGGNPVGSLTMLKKTPRMTFGPMPEKNTQSSPFTPVVESTSPMPILFTSNNLSVAVIENNQVKIVGEGGAEITAFQLGDHGYLGQSASQYLVVKKVSQTITVNAIPSKTYGDPSFTISATSSSGLPVTFSGYQSVSVSGNTSTVVSAGIGLIIARQEGNDVYAPAPDVNYEVLVNKAQQTITFNTASARTCCQYFELEATSSAQLPVAFKTTDPTKVSIYQSSAAPVGIGDVEIVAYSAGNSNYEPAEARGTVTILKGDQTISFNIPGGPIKFGDPPLFIGAGSSSGLPLTFTSDPPGIAVAENGQLHFLGVGTTTITASQNGNNTYNAAIPVARIITVGAPQTPATGNTITWTAELNRTAADTPFNLTASATSGLPVSYTSSNPAVLSVNGNLVTVLGTGSSTITATQPGNSSVPAAQSVAKQFLVSKHTQQIYFPYIGTVQYGSDPIALQPTTNEGLPIEYTSSDETIASVVNYLLVLHSSGYVSITASQPGNEKFLAAIPQTNLVSVIPKYQDITFPVLGEKTFGDAPFDLTATSSSGLTVSYTSGDESIATISGSKLIIKGAGSVSIIAKQDGYPGYYYTESLRTLIIKKANQVLSFAPLSGKKFGDAPFLISGSSTSKLPVVFVSATPAVATVSGNIVTITGSGTAKIVATQPGNQNFAAAENIIREFVVTDIGNTYNLVGSTYAGGTNGSGTLFTMDSEGSGFNTFKEFAARTSPLPQSGFIKGTDGKLYGNFSSGGTNNSGRIIRIEADGSGFTELFSFDYATTGSSPFGNLIQASNGDLYGMTNSGGSYNAGTIFRVKTDGTGFTVLHHFDSWNAQTPLGGLLQATNGKLYGIARYGGFFGAGSIFSINPDGTDFSVVLHLNNNSPLNSGTYSRGDLIQGPDGFLYGTLMQGGTNLKGTLFKVKTDGTSFQKLIEFDGPLKGESPSSTPIIASDGKIYCMTQFGGTNGLGTVFSINTNGTGYTRLLDFNGTDGSYPTSKLVEGSDGQLYGMTYAGGSNGIGTIFRISKNGSGFHKMADLSTSASNPVLGALLESTPGNFFGMTFLGGASNAGTIFKITSADQFTVVRDFPQEESTPRQLISDPTGQYYYGMTLSGGANGNGGIFRIKASDSSYEWLMDAAPGMWIASIFYVTTGHLWVGGAQDGYAKLFRLNKDGSGFQSIMDFDDPVGKGTGLRWMVESSSGDIYGTATGGVNNAGLGFKIKNDGTQFLKLFDMPAGAEIDGAPLIEGSDGNFYVCTYHAELYRFTPSGALTKIFTVPDDAGEIPVKMLSLNDGRIGIITRNLGSKNYGSIFTLEKDGSNYGKVFDAIPSVGIAPTDMVQGSDGWFFVAAEMGGTHDKGTIYKVNGDGSSAIVLKDFSGTDGNIPNSLFFLKQNQSFSFDPIEAKKTSDPAFVPVAISTSGSPVQFSSSNPTVAVVDHGMIKPLSVGTTVITARLPASATFYEAPGTKQQSLVVTKGDQVITFESLQPVDIGTPPFELTAVASSGLTVTYLSSNPSVASISGTTITIHAAGSITITASQAGDNNFFAAASVQQNLVVNAVTRKPQTIQFPNPGNKTLTDAPFQLNATSSSGLPVTFLPSNDRISIIGSTVTIQKAGNVTIGAQQVGNTEYEPAPVVQATFCINPPKPFITQAGAVPNLTLQSSNSGGNQWYNNNVLISGATGNTLSVTSTGSYSVVTTIDVCSSAPSEPILINITGIENLPEVRLDIMPNPTSDELNVSIDGQFSSAIMLELVDAMGRTVESAEVLQGGVTKFDLRSSGDGLYLLKATMNGKMIVRRIVKQ